eukprot:scaffold46362_cov163-Isochrysis_galbana.AAC.2
MVGWAGRAAGTAAMAATAEATAAKCARRTTRLAFVERGVDAARERAVERRGDGVSSAAAAGLEHSQAEQIVARRQVQEVLKVRTGGGHIEAHAALGVVVAILKVAETVWETEAVAVVEGAQAWAAAGTSRGVSDAKICAQLLRVRDVPQLSAEIGNSNTVGHVVAGTRQTPHAPPFAHPVRSQRGGAGGGVGAGPAGGNGFAGGAGISVGGADGDSGGAGGRGGVGGDGRTTLQSMRS